jgi:hypothetical protein
VRRLRHVAPVIVAIALAAPAFLATASPVAAECTFVPPLPRISMAVSTAKDLFVGDVVAGGSGLNGPSVTTFTIRITEVLRGPAAVGQMRTLSEVAPNWPWTMPSDGGKAYPSCSTLLAVTGERVIVALGARTSGQILHQNGQSWFQPPTIFNTIALVSGSFEEGHPTLDRQVFSLTRLRKLAELAEPPTDTTSTAAVGPDRASPGKAGPLVGAAVAGLLLGLIAPRRGIRRSKSAAGASGSAAT